VIRFSRLKIRKSISTSARDKCPIESSGGHNASATSVVMHHSWDSICSGHKHKHMLFFLVWTALMHNWCTKSEWSCVEPFETPHLICGESQWVHKFCSTDLDTWSPSHSHEPVCSFEYEPICTLFTEEHCNWFKRLMTQSRTSRLCSINTNESTHSRYITCVNDHQSLCLQIVRALWRYGAINLTVIKMWVALSSTVWNQSQCFAIMPSGHKSQQQNEFQCNIGSF